MLKIFTFSIMLSFALLCLSNFGSSVGATEVSVGDGIKYLAYNDYGYDIFEIFPVKYE